jgi:hypothetical protein
MPSGACTLIAGSPAPLTKPRVQAPLGVRMILLLCRAFVSSSVISNSVIRISVPGYTIPYSFRTTHSVPMSSTKTTNVIGAFHSG